MAILKEKCEIVVNGELTINDDRALDLARGAVARGDAFKTQHELLEYLAVRMRDGELVNSITGWRDVLPNAVLFEARGATADVWPA